MTFDIMLMNFKYWKNDLLANYELIASEIRGKKGIYVFKCLINKKIYIGSSVNLKRRFYSHTNISFSKLRLNIDLKNDIFCFYFYS
uniref:Orf85 n=1 Tax=Rhizophydium sp. 136 TaxID=60187 RepID=Q950P5_9FUNG|nr:orf85 [Rhizophydium sp. 136]AAK84263.1 orf85 [Rhizophydium sp. 136]